MPRPRTACTTSLMFLAFAATLGVSACELTVKKDKDNEGGSDSSSNTNSGDTSGEKAPPATPEEACTAYLECAQEVAPETVGALVATYGSEGSCFTQSDAEAELCGKACANAHKNLQTTFHTGPDSACATTSACGDGWYDSPWPEHFEGCIPTCVADGSGWPTVAWSPNESDSGPVACTPWNDLKSLVCNSRSDEQEAALSKMLEALEAYCGSEDLTWASACDICPPEAEFTLAPSSSGALCPDATITCSGAPD